MTRILINTIVFVAGIIVLFFLASQLVEEKKLPSLGEFLASSTEIISSSTQQLMGSTTLEQIFGTSTISTTTSQTGPSANSIIIKKRLALDFPSTTLFAPKGSVKVFVANNDKDREQGLSDTTELPKGTGVLFAFEKPGKYGFWMKDMLYPIDIIWIGKDKKIVGVTKNVLPKSYPFVFMPPSDVLYVLEMNVGSVNVFGLTTGSTVKFDLPVDNFL